MKKIINALSILMTAAMLMSFVACSSPSGSGSGSGSGGGTNATENPFDGTSWYGDTKDKKDVKLLEFDKTNYYGATIYRCENVEELYFGGEDPWRLTKGNKQPYSVEKKEDGSYVATTQIFKYSVVIPSADSTTGYISIERNNQILKININKK